MKTAINHLGRVVRECDLSLYRSYAEGAYRQLRDSANYQNGAYEDALKRTFLMECESWVNNYFCVFEVLPVDDTLYYRWVAIGTPVQTIEGPTKALEAVRHQNMTQHTTKRIKPLKTAQKSVSDNLPQKEVFKNLLGWQLTEFQVLYERITSAKTLDELEIVGAVVADMVYPTHPDWNTLVQAGAEKQEELLLLLKQQKKGNI